VSAGEPIPTGLCSERGWHTYPGGDLRPPLGSAIACTTCGERHDPRITDERAFDLWNIVLSHLPEEQLKGMIEAEKPRKVSYLSTADFAKLNHACLLVSEAFGNFTTYLVGSATAKAAYRDVDVRTILDDEEFDAIFAGREFFWSLTCLGITTYLKEMTGLPVDFQIQRRTQANENYEAGTRNPIGKRARPFAGGGDATNFATEVSNDD
jgi:hypothetical protein